MSCNPTTIADSHTPSEILCKFLIKAELPKSSLLDELQETYFSSVAEKVNDCTPMNDQEQSDEWKLFGSLLMEHVSSEIREEDDEVEIELHQETFIGSLDQLGNGYGNI